MSKQAGREDVADPGPAELLDEESLPAYLRSLGLAGEGEPLAVEAAGDGNINWVRRARATGSGRSWIVKQARPALERFPEYRASTERIVFENRFYEIARDFDRDGVCPQVLHFDAPRRVLVLEDLGRAERLDHALARGADEVVASAARRLGAFLGALHRETAPRASALAARFQNGEMSRLHGDHIFLLPFRANDFPLEPAVRARAALLWRDEELGAIAARAYERYLEPRGALLHGDVQPGNVLLVATGARLLDAEIAQVSDPAFDVGTLLAHLLLPAAVRPGAARAALANADALWSAYCAASGAGADGDLAPAARYAGLEVLRRTIGAARVEAARAADAAFASIELGLRLVRRPPETLDELASSLDSR
jgi:5-methylthioribose kinase